MTTLAREPDTLGAFRPEVEEVAVSSTGAMVSVLADRLAHGSRYLRLDCAELTSLDRATLRLVVLAHNRFLAARGTLVLVGLRGQPRNMLARTHLDEALLLADAPPPRPPRAVRFRAVQ